MSQATSTTEQTHGPTDADDVLTLAEAAAYLRVAEAAVLDLANSHSLPGRKIGHQWRFHRLGLSEWLRERSSKERLLLHAGTLADDPDRDTMLRSVYEQRGRPMVEE
jgi:excisionase family DNA binding protein